MTNAVSFTADVLDSGHYQITLAQTGPDTASLDERVWPAGSKGVGAPQSETTYALDTVRVTGNKVTCRTTAMMFFHPTVTFSLSAPNMQPSITVVSPKGTTTYPLTAAERQEIGAFLKTASFPAG